jgi:hypothetical protein
MQPIHPFSSLDRVSQRWEAERLQVGGGTHRRVPILQGANLLRELRPIALLGEPGQVLVAVWHSDIAVESAQKNADTCGSSRFEKSQCDIRVRKRERRV